MCPPKMLPSALVSRGIMMDRMAGFRASDMVSFTSFVVSPLELRRNRYGIYVSEKKAVENRLKLLFSDSSFN